MTWIWDAQYFGPTCTVAGAMIGGSVKLWLDRRKAAREKDAQSAAQKVAVAEIASDAAEHAALDRAADRQQAVVQALLSGLTEIRGQLADNHKMTLDMLAEERARLERLADNAIKALSVTRSGAGKG